MSAMVGLDEPGGQRYQGVPPGQRGARPGAEPPQLRQVWPGGVAERHQVREAAGAARVLDGELRELRRDQPREVAEVLPGVAQGAPGGLHPEVRRRQRQVVPEPDSPGVHAVEHPWQGTPEDEASHGVADADGPSFHYHYHK